MSLPFEPDDVDWAGGGVAGPVPKSPTIPPPPDVDVELQLPFQLPDLDDINWVDLEFLDLASGPPAQHQQEKNRNRNPTLGDNFPDIFFDMTTSSLFNADDHAKLFNEPFKDASVPLDLDTVEKNLLADLFPPVQPVPDDDEDEEAATSPTRATVASKAPSSSSAVSEQNSAFIGPHMTGSGLGKVSSGSGASTSNASQEQLADGVYAVPMDVLQIISKNFTQLQDDFEKETGEKEEKEKEPFKPRTRVLRVHSRRGTVLSTSPDTVPKNAVAQISLRTNRADNTTHVTILPAPGKTGQRHSFQVGTANLSKALKLLGPLRLERLSLFRDILMKQQFKDVVEPTIKDATGVKAAHACTEPGCSRSFNRPAKLKQHLLSHKNIKPFKCPEKDCPWSFQDNYKLKRHQASHSKSAKTFACTLDGCDTKFSTVSNLRKHLVLHERSRDFACEVCAEGFATKRALTEHRRQHADFYPTFSCTGCGEKFFTQKDLKLHAPKHDSPVKSNIICGFEGCGKEFAKQELLKVHAKIHTGIRPFHCAFPGCSWSFPTSSKLRRHERAHTNTRNHVCDHCGKSYLRAEHLRGHLLSHSEHPTKFICAFPDCGAKYANKSSLYAHMKEGRNHHQPQQQQQHLIMFRCLLEDCPMLFERSADLGQHVKEQHFMVEESNASESGPTTSSSDPNLELDFVALLSSVEASQQQPMAAETKPAAMVADQVVITTSKDISFDAMDTTGTTEPSVLVTVDASAITPVKAARKKIKIEAAKVETVNKTLDL